MTAVNCILATLALIVSGALFYVHYRNQVERRHAEIVQLRTQIISSLAALQQRLASVLMNGELLRIELRRIPDTDDKYQSIERIPRLLSSVSELKGDVEKSAQMFEKMDSEKMNRSAILLRLQRQAATLPDLVSRAQRMEEEMLSLLTDVRKLAEA